METNEKKYESRLPTFLRRVFEPIQEDMPAAYFTRDLTKWVFDFVRNLLILGVLKYFADRTGNTYLFLTFWACFVVFVLYCISYWQVWYFHLFALIPIKNSLLQSIARITDFILNVALGLFLLIWGNRTLSIIADELSRAQAK
jgi:hypothetical protein